MARSNKEKSFGRKNSRPIASNEASEEAAAQYKHEIKIVLQTPKTANHEAITKEGIRAAEVGFLYTCGLHKKRNATKDENSENKTPSSSSRPEFLVRNVPRDKMARVAFVLNFLSDREVKHDNTITSQRLHFRAKHVTDNNQRRELLQNYLCAVPNKDREDVSVVELIPRYGDTTKDDDPARWGMYPAAPEGRDTLVERIMTVKLPEKTIRRIDGDRENCAETNCEWVRVQDALRNNDQWTTDVYKSLTKKETAYVKRHVDYFLRILE